MCYRNKELFRDICRFIYLNVSESTVDTRVMLAIKKCIKVCMKCMKCMKNV